MTIAAGPSPLRMNLRVRVNSDLVLDAGEAENVTTSASYS